ncbi:MAG TPA: hypothetical protein PKY81_00520 [bacterium]|nr:hypothetical protein [bacterium]HPN29416.1 hypothetical protein [bacterium]
MKKENKKMASWELQQIEEIISTGQFKKINLSKFESLVLNTLPKNPDMAGNSLPLLDKIAVELQRGFQKVSVSEKSVRDDMLCAIVLINAVLGKDKKVAETITGVQGNKFDGINQKYVLDKLYKYMEKGDSLSKKNKIWSKLLNAYKRGEITAAKGKSVKVDNMLKREKEKGIMSKFKDFLGL